ncbi:TPA: fimbrial protein, partial [Citrobacter werkmanii]|nr:fimbrial protein [Citrobacter werkmanii]
MNMKDLLPVSLMLAGAVLMVSGDTRAAGTLGLTVNITGDVVVPPCIINGGSPVEVNFGDIPVPDIGKAAFWQKKSIPVTCAYSGGVPHVMVIGTQLQGAETNVLETSVARFGIALYQGDGTG